jgi:anti-anti-sigma factor
MLQVREQYPQTTEVLTLTGQFDRRITPGLQVLILLAQKTGRYHLILDFSRVTDIDSTSFRRLFHWYHTMKSDHLKVSLVKPRAPIWTQFHLWHVSKVVQVYASLEEATWDSTGYS